MASKPILHIKPVDDDVFEFTYKTDDGQVAGHVSVAIKEDADKRSKKDKLEDARTKIKHLAKSLHKTAKE